MDEYTLLKEVASLLKQKNRDEAAVLYQKIGNIFEKKNLIRRALAAYQKSISLKENTECRLTIARLFETLHKYFSAYESLFPLVDTFLKHQDLEQALMISQKLSELEPSLSYPKEKITEINALLGKIPSQFENKTPDLQRKENDVKTPLHLIEPKLSSTAQEDEIRSLEKELKDITAFPTSIKTTSMDLSAQTLFDLAIAYKEMELYDSAIQHLKDAIGKTPDEITKIKCILLLSECYIDGQKISEAISLLENLNQKELSKLPTDFLLSTFYTLAHAYELIGDPSKSLLYLNKISEIDKKYRDTEDRIHKIILRRPNS